MGTMGVSLSRNFASHGYKLSLYNRYLKGKEEKVALKLARKYDFFDEDLAFESLEDLSNQLVSSQININVTRWRSDR